MTMARKLALILVAGLAVFGGTLLVLHLTLGSSTPSADPAANADTSTTFDTPAATAPATPTSLDTPSELPKAVTDAPTRKASPATTSPAPSHSTPKVTVTPSIMPRVLHNFQGTWHSDDAGTTLTVGPSEQYQHLASNQGLLTWDGCMHCVLKITFKVHGSQLIGTITNYPKLQPGNGFHHGGHVVLSPTNEPNKLNLDAPGQADSTTYYIV